jgi:hypothetical protein
MIQSGTGQQEDRMRKPLARFNARAKRRVCKAGRERRAPVILGMVAYSREWVPSQKTGVAVCLQPQK